MHPLVIGCLACMIGCTTEVEPGSGHLPSDLDPVAVSGVLDQRLADQEAQIDALSDPHRFRILQAADRERVEILRRAVASARAELTDLQRRPPEDPDVALRDLADRLDAIDRGLARIRAVNEG